ncbi:MAG TPA: tRNA pseudouridine(55) synthase TruB [bacterium]|nr:tRNA pseudouridine(55) synthase TruB [bacterium]HPT29513.1 tRNA pseudouridine(55) synthase TruB [bacterium]
MDTITPKTGFILIDKPQHISSHAVVSILRRITNTKRIGHAGTLDPLATGLLILAIGREATKRLDEFAKQDKEYIAAIRFGFESVSYDAEGPITQIYSGLGLEKEKIMDALSSFLGKIEQYPPKYSAKKQNGKRLYQLARKNQPIELKPSLVEIKGLDILDYSWPDLKVKVNCGTGTYIRSLAHDLGKKLGCGAYLSDLRRTRIGAQTIDRAVELDTMDRDNWVKYLF